MHGTIFGELKRFANDEFGRGTWRSLLDGAQLAGQRYSPTEAYPDDQFGRLVEVATDVTERSADQFLEEFGLYIGPRLLNQYEDLLDPDSSVLDVLEHTEEVFHTAISRDADEVSPPDLSDTERLDDSKLVVFYRSERKMCPMARGISRSMAKRFGETLSISEPRCMHDGDEECELHFRLG